MDIYYKTRPLEKICNSFKESQKKYGKKLARKLHQRLAELKAANNLEGMSDFPSARCHELSSDSNRKGQMSVDVEHPKRLIFIVAMEPVPRKEDGGIDRSEVTKIEIIEIVDYH